MTMAELPQPDLRLTRDSELMVVQVEGDTDAGVEFVDAFVPTPYVEFTVVDSGRIIVPEEAAEGLRAAAREQGLVLEEEER